MRRMAEGPQPSPVDDIVAAAKRVEQKIDQLEPDMVNHPPHYNKAGIEAIDAIAAATEEGFEYHLQGTALKYLWRYRYKNGLEDLMKCRWYLDKLIRELQKKEQSLD